MAIGFTYIGCRCGATEGGRWGNGGGAGKKHRVIGHSAGLARAQGCSLARERETLKTNAFQTMREKSESRGSKRAPEHAAERDVKLDWIETLAADFPATLCILAAAVY